jgi:hypothetical protein
MRITLAEAGSCDPVPVLEIGWGRGGGGVEQEEVATTQRISLCAKFDGGIATADISYSMTCMCVHLFQDRKA